MIRWVTQCYAYCMLKPRLALQFVQQNVWLTRKDWGHVYKTDRMGWTNVLYSRPEYECVPQCLVNKRICPEQPVSHMEYRVGQGDQCCDQISGHNLGYIMCKWSCNRGGPGPFILTTLAGHIFVAFAYALFLHIPQKGIWFACHGSWYKYLYRT